MSLKLVNFTSLIILGLSLLDQQLIAQTAFPDTPADASGVSGKDEGLDNPDGDEIPDAERDGEAEKANLLPSENEPHTLPVPLAEPAPMPPGYPPVESSILNPAEVVPVAAPSGAGANSPATPLKIQESPKTSLRALPIVQAVPYVPREKSAAGMEPASSETNAPSKASGLPGDSSPSKGGPGVVTPYLKSAELLGYENRMQSRLEALAAELKVLRGKIATLDIKRQSIFRTYLSTAAGNRSVAVTKLKQLLYSPPGDWIVHRNDIDRAFIDLEGSINRAREFIKIP